VLLRLNFRHQIQGEHTQFVCVVPTHNAKDSSLFDDMPCDTVAEPQVTAIVYRQ
jgi:hypothetical protein